jgi:hypothetical protein
VDDEYYKVLVIVVAAVLSVSLLINVILAADLNAFTRPPVRVHGYFTEKGEPAPGYYIAPASGLSASEMMDGGMDGITPVGESTVTGTG